MSFSKYRYTALLVVLQLILTGFVFSAHFKAPSKTVLCTWGDGAKNYYSLQSYVASPIDSGGLFKFDKFAYPFGDYVLYTDNTPSFSIPLRWFCQHIYDISSYAIPLFDFLILFNFIVCSVLAFKLFSALLRHNNIAFWLALILPWVSPQIQRIWCGHFNLSLSFIIPLAILLFLYWVQVITQPRKQIFAAVCIILFAVFSFFTHGYYLVIATFFLSLMMVLHGLFYYRQNRNWKPFVCSVFVSLACVLMVLLLVKYTDGYLDLRKETAHGYDNPEQKTIFAQLFTPYPYNTLFFPLHGTNISENYELNSYLGNIALYSLLFLSVGFVFHQGFRKSFLSVQREYFSDPVRKSIFFAGLLLLMVSFGEQYYTSAKAMQLSFPFQFPAHHRMASITLFSLCVICCAGMMLVLAKSKLRFSEKKGYTLLAVSVGALLLYAMMAGYSIRITNYANPFYYAHLFSNKVEHFRSLTRFNWPFYWTLYIWLGFTVLHLLRGSSAALQRGVLLFLLFAGLSEMLDSMAFLQHKSNKLNPFLAPDAALYKAHPIDYSRYQALLPLPFFMAGSEDYDYTYNDEDDFSTIAMNLALQNKLPLIASKMARTPPAFSKQAIDFIAYDQISTDLKARLNSKPILIILSKKLVADTSGQYIPAPDQPVARKSFFQTLQFPERHHLVPIDSMEGNYYYEYYPKK